MLRICLVVWKSEPQYAYKRYAYKKKHVPLKSANNLFEAIKLILLVSEPYNLRKG